MATASYQVAGSSLPSTSSLTLKHQILGQQIAQLYTIAPVGIIASLMTGLILVSVLWNEVHHQVLISWLLGLAAVNAIWCMLVYRYHTTYSSVTDVSSWCTWFLVGNTASGLMWGAAGFILYPTDSIAHEIFLTLILGGMIAGSTAVHSALLQAFFAYSLPTLVPLTFRIFQQGDELHLAMGMLSLLFIAMMGMTARRNHHMIVGGMRLQYENAQLLEQVSMSRDRLESIVEARTVELKTSETRYRLLAENITDVIWVMALDGSHYTYVSPSVLPFLGYTTKEAMALSLEESLTSPSAQKAQRALEEEVVLEQSGHADPFRSCILELEYCCKDGSSVWAEMRGSILRSESGHIVGMVGVTRDITERRKMEEEKQNLEVQLQNFERIESVGTLAAGIAHDFNNFLTSILGNISLASQPNISSQTRSKFLSLAERATLRAKDLPLQLLTFAKGGEPIKQLVGLEMVIKESSSFALSGSAVICEYVFPPDLWLSSVDTGQMSQVIHNLVMNAVQAMPSGGKITICAENLHFDTKTVDMSIPLPPGSYVKVSLCDEGKGIPDQYLPKIFDPYFTTRSDGHGLGLASVYSIMTKHGGFISADSQEGVGTKVTLMLPASPCGRMPSPAEILHSKQGSGNILVMDDDESIRILTREILTSFGYCCELAKDGYEAISRYEAAMKSEQKFSTVILDLTVTGSIGGKEVLKRLQRIDPDVKAIVSSGYSNDPVMANYQIHGFQGVVLKPYSIEKLSDVVYQVIMEPSFR